MTLARHWYRALLRALPADLRDAHGAEMEEMFVDELCDARRRGRAREALAWVAAAADIARRAPYEHWRRRNIRQLQDHRREQPMHSFLSDLRFAIRSFARQPGATALVIPLGVDAADSDPDIAVADPR